MASSCINATEQSSNTASSANGSSSLLLTGAGDIVEREAALHKLHVHAARFGGGEGHHAAVRLAPVVYAGMMLTTEST